MMRNAKRKHIIPAFKVTLSGQYQYGKKYVYGWGDLELLLEELDKKKDDYIYNFEEFSNQIWILEDQISELRIQLNELNETSSKLKADEAALNAEIQLYDADI